MALEWSELSDAGQALCTAAEIGSACLSRVDHDTSACLLADVSMGAEGCAFLWGMQNLQTLSLARTRLEHDSMAAVLSSLKALTTLSLGWCALPCLFHLKENVHSWA